jgi:hypothetical protein
MAEEISGPYRFTVLPRAVEIGGGWRVRAYETMPGGEEVEMHGGIFPGEGDKEVAYAQALAEAQEWLANMPKPEHRYSEHYMMGHFSRSAAAKLGE